MIRAYIAGPIAGKAELNEPDFRSAASFVRDMGVREPTIPHDIPVREHDGDCPTTYAAGQSEHDAACYLRADLAWIALHADEVWLIPGWAESRGATLEEHVARAFGIQVFELPEVAGQ